MLLYRIRRKGTKEYFCGLRAPWSKKWGKENWNDVGVFYKNIDTINDYLLILSRDWHKHYKLYSWCSHRTANKMAKVLRRKKRYIERLENLEVVINDITIKKEKVIDAINFKETNQ